MQSKVLLPINTVIDTSRCPQRYLSLPRSRYHWKKYYNFGFRIHERRGRDGRSRIKTDLRIRNIRRYSQSNRNGFLSIPFDWAAFFFSFFFFAACCRQVLVEYQAFVNFQVTLRPIHAALSQRCIHLPLCPLTTAPADESYVSNLVDLTSARALAKRPDLDGVLCVLFLFLPRSDPYFGVVRETNDRRAVQRPLAPVLSRASPSRPPWNGRDAENRENSRSKSRDIGGCERCKYQC